MQCHHSSWLKRQLYQSAVCPQAVSGLDRNRRKGLLPWGSSLSQVPPRRNLLGPPIPLASTSLEQGVSMKMFQNPLYVASLGISDPPQQEPRRHLSVSKGPSVRKKGRRRWRLWEKTHTPGFMGSQWLVACGAGA